MYGITRRIKNTIITDGISKSKIIDNLDSLVVAVHFAVDSLVRYKSDAGYKSPDFDFDLALFAVVADFFD